MSEWCGGIRLGGLIGVGLVLLASLPATAFELRVRDSRTGAPLTAQVTLRQITDMHTCQSPQTGVVDIVDGVGALQLSDCAWSLSVRASGYTELGSVVTTDVASGSTVLLDPLQEPASLRAGRELAARTPEQLLLQGYVRDVRSAAPIADAVVSLDAGVASTRSDRDGYFRLQAAGSDNSDERGLRHRVQVQAHGYARYERREVLVAPGASELLVLLGDRPVLQFSEQRPLMDLDPRESIGNGVEAASSSAAEQALPMEVTPPASIRVGFNDVGCTSSCCGTSCSDSCTMSLETYVRRGLDSEWIASWNTQSLRAGSLAYRSYGAWHVLHPRTASYDICSSACCQVNDAITSSSTDAAIARTPGLMLSRDGIEAYRAEYSAENNAWDDPNDGLACSNVDLSCGNGFVGSPSTSWPCMTDAVAAGRGCFGHGRGMSQWGTQRWAIAAAPKQWKWIVNHYFNDNGNESGAGSGQRTAAITTPLQISAISASPVAVNAGAGFTIQASVQNLAGASHDHLLIGASLYRSGVGYISDPAHDAPVSAAIGSSNQSRAFDVPPGTAVGVYDLLVALYLDVDENGLISAEDLALAIRSRGQYVSVGNDRIFAHAFEP